MAKWLAAGKAAAGQGYLTSESGPLHRPSRQWFGQVMPGSWAPSIDSDGIDGKRAGVAAIQAHDPAFDENVLLAQVQRLFFAVLTAWTGLKPGPVPARAAIQGNRAPVRKRLYASAMPFGPASCSLSKTDGNGASGRLYARISDPGTGQPKGATRPRKSVRASPASAARGIVRSQ